MFTTDGVALRAASLKPGSLAAAVAEVADALSRISTTDAGDDRQGSQSGRTRLATKSTPRVRVTTCVKSSQSLRMGWTEEWARRKARFPPRRAAAEGGRYFLSESRISRSSTTSSGAAGGGTAFFSLFICLTIRKMMKARIEKLIATVMKLP